MEAAALSAVARPVLQEAACCHRMSRQGGESEEEKVQKQELSTEEYLERGENIR